MHTPASNTVASVIPCLRYRDAPAAIDWLCRTFGFQRKLVVPGEDGQVLHAELTYASPNGANGMLMLGSSVRDNAYGRLMRHVDEAGGNTQSLYLVVADPDACSAAPRPPAPRSSSTSRTRTTAVAASLAAIRRATSGASAAMIPGHEAPSIHHRRRCMKTLTLIDGQEVAAIGQGTWHIGEQPGERKREVAALREGIELGMTLIDTAEMYAEGGAEDVVGAAIAGRREEVFLVSKVYPHNASRKGLPAACERSLRRLGCETIDLYLLHWQGRYPLEETIEAFERLRDQGKILRWGVSNFDLGDMYELDGSACAANQVMYNLEERGIEYDLLPWCQERGMPVMAYCPVGQGGRLLRHPALGEIAARHDASSAQVALAWLLEQGVIAIPKAVTSAHIRQNTAAADLELSADDLRALDQAFPPPTRKRNLAIV